LLARPERPTTIFAFSDQLALGTLGAAHDAGISVPDRLSVVGFGRLADRPTPPTRR